MESTLRLFVPDINLREYGWKCISGILLILLLHMLAVSAEKFSTTDKSENVTQVLWVTTGEDMFADGMEVLKERVLYPFAWAETKAGGIGTVLVPDPMIVQNAQTEMNESENTVSKLSDTVTPPSTDATIVSPNNAATEETETPVLWEVTCYGNGGVPALVSYSFDGISFAGNDLAVPTYEGKIFTGWYEDEECTIPFELAKGEKRKLSLYAGWKTKGYALSDRGYLMDCEPEMVFDGLLLLPSDGACKGVEAHAFDNLTQMIEEIYIPANITDIASGVFENLTNLIYVEVAPDNPVYYSVNGQLYTKDGDHLVK